MWTIRDVAATLALIEQARAARPHRRA